MTGFKREIRVVAGYDYRDEPGGRGADGCGLVLILTGDLGAITAEIDTGWMARPLAGRLVRGGPQERRETPGLDAGLVDCFPAGRGMYAHSRWPREGFDGGRDECPWLDGAECFNYGSLSGADRVLGALVSGGSDAAFEVLAESYTSWLAERAVMTA